MNTYTTQSSIVARLAVVFATLLVRWEAKDLPEFKPEADLPVPNEKVFVGYVGGAGANQLSSSVTIQEKKISFKVEIHSTRQYGPNGIYAIQDVVEQALLGYKPTNGKQLTYSRDDLLVDVDRGIWILAIVFDTTLVMVPKDSSEPIVVPSFTGLNSNES
jgi:hypothetical protein